MDEAKTSAFGSKEVELPAVLYDWSGVMVSAVDM